MPHQYFILIICLVSKFYLKDNGRDQIHTIHTFIQQLFQISPTILFTYLKIILLYYFQFSVVFKWTLSHNLWRLRNQLNNLTVITLDIMEVIDPQVHLSSSCVTYLSLPLFYLCSETAWLKSWKSCWIIPFQVVFQISRAYVFRPNGKFPMKHEEQVCDAFWSRLSKLGSYIGLLKVGGIVNHKIRSWIIKSYIFSYLKKKTHW